MSEMTPTGQVSGWLAALDAALGHGDADSAAALFNDDNYSSGARRRKPCGRARLQSI